MGERNQKRKPNLDLTSFSTPSKSRKQSQIDHFYKPQVTDKDQKSIYTSHLDMWDIGQDIDRMTVQNYKIDDDGQNNPKIPPTSTNIIPGPTDSEVHQSETQNTSENHPNSQSCRDQFHGDKPQNSEKSQSKYSDPQKRYQ